MAAYIHDADGRGHPSEPNTHRLSAKSILEQHSSLRIDPRNIQTDHKPHAKGGQADITPGTLKRPTGVETRVAVKKLRYDGQTDNDKFSKSFAYEVDILAGLSHTNIVELIGFLEDLESGNACMVFTWEENGNVQEFLARRTCDIPERVSLIKDVTDGVNYLHTRQPPICHGDLKSLNILVNSLYRAVITDFGSARVLRGKRERKVTRTEPKRDIPGASSQINVSVTGNQLTLTGPFWSLRWASPEVVLGASPDLPSDIWAVGWVVWEIITDKVPFHEICNETAVTLAVIEKKNPSDIGDDEQMSQIISLCNLVRDCLTYDPASRPTATKCRTSVKWMPSVVPTESSTKFRSAALLLNMGYMRYSQNDHEAAAALFNEALASAYAAQDPLSAAEALNWLGEVGVAQQRYSDAESSFSQARDVHTSLGNASGRMRALDGLGGVYHSQGLFAQAEESYMKAERICVQIGDDVGRANILNGIGGVRLMQSRYSEAKECYVQALDIYDRVGNDLGRANSLSGLGSVAYAQRHYEEGEEIFAEAEGICVRIGNEMGLANMLSGVAAVLFAKSGYDQAAACYNRALGIFNRVGNDPGRANSLKGLGIVQHARRQYKEAQRSFFKAGLLFAQIGNDMEHANILTRIGSVDYMESRYLDAIERFREALAIYSRAANDLGRASSLYGLGSVHYAECRYEEAEAVLVEAEDICTRIGNQIALAHVLSGIAAVHLARGSVSSAEARYTMAARIFKSVGIDSDEANWLTRLGRAYCSHRKLGEALKCFEEVKGIWASNGHDVEHALALEEIAEIQLGKPRGSDKAKACYTELLSIYSRIGDDSGRAYSMRGLGSVELRELRPEGAKEHFSEAESICARIGDEEGRAEAQRLISLATEGRGVRQQAALTRCVCFMLSQRREMRQRQPNQWRWDQPSFF